MAYTRTYTIDASPGGDTVKAAIATKLDGDLTNAFTYLNEQDTALTNAVTLLNAHGIATTDVHGFTGTKTGSGAMVGATSPTLVTPVLGIATATSINKVVITQPATSAVLTIADSKTLTVTDNVTLPHADVKFIILTAKTTDDTLSVVELIGNVVITNTGAEAAINLTLQAGAADYSIEFEVTVAQYLKVTAAGANKFRYYNIEGAGGGYIRSNTIGTRWRITWSGGNWSIHDLVGVLYYDE